ncbi:MAG: FliM/FliN family flagellar motor switch protein [Planctomycetota bacterium]
MIDANTFLATFEATPEGCAEPFTQCFDTPGVFAAEEAAAFDADAKPSGLEGPGVVVYLTFGEQAAAVAVPETLPLPDWIHSPDDSQAARLQTLAMEWSLTLAPEGLEATEFETRVVADIAAAVIPDGEAQYVPLKFRPEGEDDGPAFWIGPVTIPAPEAAADAPPSGDAATAPTDAGAADGSTAEEDAAWDAERRRRIRRLQQVPVQIVVELARKKVDLESILSLSQGSLVTFSKSCEEPVDLYVNNYRYCRGEAVKIGENFGLKVTEVGVVEAREKRVF